MQLSLHIARPYLKKDVVLVPWAFGNRSTNALPPISLIYACIFNIFRYGYTNTSTREYINAWIDPFGSINRKFTRDYIFHVILQYSTQQHSNTCSPACCLDAMKNLWTSVCLRIHQAILAHENHPRKSQFHFSSQISYRNLYLLKIFIFRWISNSVLNSMLLSDLLATPKTTASLPINTKDKNFRTFESFSLELDISFGEDKTNDFFQICKLNSRECPEKLIKKINETKRRDYIDKFSPRWKKAKISEKNEWNE